MWSPVTLSCLLMDNAGSGPSRPLCRFLWLGSVDGDPWDFFPRAVPRIPRSSTIHPSYFALRTLTTTMLPSRNPFAAFLIVAAVVASGSPVEPEKGQDTKVKFCEGRFWQEPCRVPDSVILDKCHEFSSEFGLTNIKSFGPPPGMACVLYM